MFEILYTQGDLTKVFSWWLQQIGKGFDLMKKIYIFDNISLFHFLIASGLIILLMKIIHFNVDFTPTSEGTFVSTNFSAGGSVGSVNVRSQKKPLKKKKGGK